MSWQYVIHDVFAHVLQFNTKYFIKATLHRIFRF